MRPLLLALALFVAGCGTTFPLTADPSIPFAEGQVLVSARDEGGLEIDLSTLHMGDPGKLSPEAVAYVVWVRPLGPGPVASPENVGAFKPTSELKGALTFKTTHTELELFVTIEPTPEATAPTGRVVLRGEVSGIEAARAPVPPPGPSASVSASVSAAPPVEVPSASPAPAAPAQE